MRFLYIATLGLVFAAAPGEATEPAAGKPTMPQATQRFAHGRVIVAPPIAERASPSRHKRILQAFAAGSVGALGAQQAERDQVRQVFGSALLNRLPTVEKLREFQKVTKADTVVLTLLRFLPRDHVVAEIWFFSHNHPEPVKIVATEILYTEAKGSLYMVAGPVNNSVVDNTSNGWIPVTPEQHALVKIHPQLNNGGTVSGLSPEEAQGCFDFMGNSLGHQARVHFDKVWWGDDASFIVNKKVSSSVKYSGNIQKFVSQASISLDRFQNSLLQERVLMDKTQLKFSVPMPQSTLRNRYVAD
jgi:hypothetical protein